MTFSIVMQEWQTLTPNTEENLLKFFVSDDPRAKAIYEHIGDAITFDEGRYGTSISTSSYIGRLQLGELELTIRPKIQMHSLLNLLCYAYNLRDLHLTMLTAQSLDQHTFQDLLIRQLIIEVNELISRGLARDYVRQSEDLSTPRGRIELMRLVRQGGIIEATLPCEHYPRVANTLHNQLLLSGLRYAVRLTEDITLRVEARRLAKRLEMEITPIKLTSQALAMGFNQLTRLTEVYESALTLIALLLEGHGISIDDGKLRRELPGFLFDMNSFWESLLSKFLRKSLEGYQVHDQYRSPMMKYREGENPRRRKHPTPRPDYVVMLENKMIAILDAKYIDLWNRPPDAKILYQLGMYALGHDDVRHSIILYPTIDAQATTQKIEIQDAVYRHQKGLITIQPVNLYELEKLIQLRGIMGQRHRRNYARSLLRKINDS